MKADLQGRLVELLAMVDEATDLQPLAVAIAAEHSFGIVFADDDLVAERLCAPEALAFTLAKYVDDI